MTLVAAMDQQWTTVAGKTYQLTYDISSYSFSTGTARVYVGSTQGASDLLNATISSNGSKSHTFVATGATAWGKFITEADTTFDLDNVVCGLPPIDEGEAVGVVFKKGFKPRFFVNESFVGEGDSTVSPSTGTTALDIGNENELTDVTAFDLKQTMLANRPLSDHEMLCIFQQAKMINRQPV